jgi:hypothetical protein
MSGVLPDHIRIRSDLPGIVVREGGKAVERRTWDDRRIRGRSIARIGEDLGGRRYVGASLRSRLSRHLGARLDQDRLCRDCGACRLNINFGGRCRDNVLAILAGGAAADPGATSASDFATIPPARWLS